MHVQIRGKGSTRVEESPDPMAMSGFVSGSTAMAACNTSGVLR